MKKRLLLVLTIVMLMCIAMFSANAAADCGDGKHTVTKKTVAPTCEAQGYDVNYCSVCKKEFGKSNYTSPIGHVFSADPVAANTEASYYVKECQRKSCNATEKENGDVVMYYTVRFVNAKATKSYLETYNGVPVKHAKLTDEFETVDLLSKTVFVKHGGSYKYTGAMPKRNKDVAYGKYNFVGWTTDVNNDTNPAESTIMRGIEEDPIQYVTVSGVTKNTIYYACWQGDDNVTYSVQFVNEDGSSWISANNGAVTVKHGDKINYIWIYPSKASTTASDFEFIGWGCGDSTKVDKNGNKTEYDEYLLSNNMHIKSVPIFSADAMKAVYKSIPREYKAQFDLKDGNVVNVPGLAYGADLGLKKNGNDYTVNLNGTNHTILYENRVNDETYTYIFNNGFKTTTGHEMKNGYFTVPQHTPDANDVIYLKYFNSVTGTFDKYMINDELVVIDNPVDSTAKTLFGYFEEEKNHYETCKNTNKLYKAKYFDLNTRTTFYVATDNEEFLFDTDGNKLTLEVSLNGIKRVMYDGSKYAFSVNDAKALRVVKVEPMYRSIIRMYPLVVEVVMPVIVDGESLESDPFSFNDLLTVQVKNQNGKLLARSTTGNNTRYEAEKYTDTKGNTYVKFFCVLSVEKADRYVISVASNDAREKYVGERTLYWTTYKSMYDSTNNVMKTNAIVDLSISADYNKGLNCFCLCHGILSGLWARILNTLYSLFKVQYVCCDHMHATIGDILAY